MRSNMSRTGNHLNVAGIGSISDNAQLANPASSVLPSGGQERDVVFVKQK